MITTLKYFIPVSVMLITAMFLAGDIARDTVMTLGSVGQGNEYYSDRITSDDASTTAITTLKTGVGSLGSVVVTTENSGTAMTIYDATSTMATSTATVLASFGTTTYGTYVFDGIFTNGLSFEVPSGFTGEYIITWR